jgi:hypothetical protein
MARVAIIIEDDPDQPGSVVVWTETARAILDLPKDALTPSEKAAIEIVEGIVGQSEGGEELEPDGARLDLPTESSRILH